MRQIAEFIAVLACGLFAGAAVYVSLVEHPARMECGIEIATAEFPPSYHRGTIMQVTLAALGLLSSIAAWLFWATFWWLIAGALLGSVIPFALVVILPTNKQLLSLALDRSAQTGQLLRCWGTLRAVKSAGRKGRLPWGCQIGPTRKQSRVWPQKVRSSDFTTAAAHRGSRAACSGP